MSHKLISRNPDLQRFWDEGYEIEIRDDHLLIHSVPYLNLAREIKYGTLVSTLHLSGDDTLKPDTHVVNFIGDAPCDKDGQTLSAIINSSGSVLLTPNINVDHVFSSKPTHGNGYSDYFEKMTTYANIISAPAKSIDDSVTEKTFMVVESDDGESVFNYLDTNSSRARINIVTEKLADQKIAIVGLGGTGSYILDLVAKTPVKEIHLFDGDIFKSNNAFRAPGAPLIEELRQRIMKTDYLAAIYGKMHRKIASHSYYVDSSNIHELLGFDFVFLSLDRGEIKKEIISSLVQANISFIDVGIGLQNVDQGLIGAVRVTTSTERKRDHVASRIPFVQEIDNEYLNNIQIADLNALNAALAAIKWKKLAGFYHDFENENHSTYTIEMNMLTSDDNDE